MLGDLRASFTSSIYLSLESIQYLSISKALSIQYIGSYIYCYRVRPDIGWVPTVLVCHIVIYCYNVHLAIGWVPTVLLSYTATVCTLI